MARGAEQQGADEGRDDEADAADRLQGAHQLPLFAARRRLRQDALQRRSCRERQQVAEDEDIHHPAVRRDRVQEVGDGARGEADQRQPHLAEAPDQRREQPRLHDDRAHAHAEQGDAVVARRPVEAERREQDPRRLQHHLGEGDERVDDDQATDVRAAHEAQQGAERVDARPLERRAALARQGLGHGEVTVEEIRGGQRGRHVERQ
ncbi:conserved hypothetical protein, partial [Ricinus communis]